MTMKEYFGDWVRVMDLEELSKIMNTLRTFNPNLLCPSPKDIFKAFKLCSYRNCRVILIFQDPYPQKGIATGIAIGNNKEPLSPSLKVIKNSVIDLSVSHNLINFDPTLESWAKQGVLLLNSSLTCEVGKIGSHTNLWRPFMKKFIESYSKDTKEVFALFGKEAQTLEPYIHKRNLILKENHPAYYVRNHQEMPSIIWKEINKFLYKEYGDKINWYGDF